MTQTDSKSAKGVRKLRRYGKLATAKYDPKARTYSLAKPGQPNRGAKSALASTKFENALKIDASGRRFVPPAVKNIVQYGSVYLNVPEFSAKARAHRATNVAAGQYALTKLASELERPGVHISHEKDIPIFRADPKAPGQVIRALNGKEDSGIFRGGVFEVC